jgi:hypothetical protein
MAKKRLPVGWSDQCEDQDYPAALSYLTLLFAPAKAKGCVKELRAAPIVTFKAKDIFRASGLSLLGVSNSHVLKDRQKIFAGIPLSPLLLVRRPGGAGLIVADGYHRLCAVYTFDEDAVIACKIV